MGSMAENQNCSHKYKAYNTYRQIVCVHIYIILRLRRDLARAHTNIVNMKTTVCVACRRPRRRCRSARVRLIHVTNYTLKLEHSTFLDCVLVRKWAKCVRNFCRLQIYTYIHTQTRSDVHMQRDLPFYADGGKKGKRFQTATMVARNTQAITDKLARQSLQPLHIKPCP